MLYKIESDRLDTLLQIVCDPENQPHQYTNDLAAIMKDFFAPFITKEREGTSTNLLKQMRTRIRDHRKTVESPIYSQVNKALLIVETVLTEVIEANENT